MDLALIIPAFIAGIFTFLAPCTLPLVPGYLGFISGASLEDLKNPAKAGRVKRKIFLNGVFFILGFTVIFVLFGTLASFLGQTLAPFRVWLTRIGGALIILFGFFMLGIFKLPFLASEKQLPLPKFLKVGHPSSSFAIGSAFAFGWTPCVGPILGSVLLLASTSTTALQGSFLLAVFSAGLAVPFLLVALGIGSATKYIERLSKYLRWVSVVGGLLLIGLGILLLTGNFSLLISYGFRLLEFINYDALLNFL